MAEIIIVFCFGFFLDDTPYQSMHCFIHNTVIVLLKASIFLSKFSCISRAFSLAVLVNSFYHNMALRFPPIL